MARVVLENVSKHYGSVAAVDGVSLTIEDGEFFALLGPSGCGKTTTLRLLAGLETADSGHICIGDRDVTRTPPRERDVAMVFQDYALYPHMTLLDNIGYPLKVRGVRHAELRQRVEEAARRLAIDQLLERRPGQLSGGQQQRAAVARAIVYQAQAFLFDEPLSNLDAKLRVEARGYLKHLQHQLAVTTVYVTHDQAEALALADRLAIMDRGHVLQVGSPLDVYHRPQTTFVASFLGSPPMNLVPCAVDLSGRRWRVNGAELGLGDIPGGQALAGKLRDGETLTFGFRPENVTIEQVQGPGTFPAQTYVTQLLGAESLVVLHAGDAPVTVRLFTDEPPQLSGQVWLKPDLRRAFLYDASGNLIA